MKRLVAFNERINASPDARKIAMSQDRQPKEHWGSRLGVVLAVAGGAVGLGNFLRFPGQVVNYGGGAFMIPYIFSFLLIAFPIACSEWAIGRYGGRLGYHSTLGVFYSVSRKSTFWGFCGGLSAMTPLIISMYYIFVEAWCLLYALQYLGGLLDHVGLGFSLLNNVQPGLKLHESEAYSGLFASFTGMHGDGSLFRSPESPLIFVTLFCAAVNFYLIYRGVSKGIERFSKIVAPLVLICSFVVIARVLTLGNPTGIEGQSLLDGLGFMWNPSRDVVGADGAIEHISIWQSLANPEVWLAATAQIFFTASICLGATCTYASFVRSREDIALSSVTSTAANEFCEVALGGLMSIPPAIMFLGAQAADKFESSFSLGFVVMPNVFEKMPAGELCGFLFFTLLFCSAITSSMSIVQPTMSLFTEALRIPRKTCIALVSAVVLSGTLFVCWFTHNLVALDAFDFWFANFAPFLGGVFQTILIVFVWKLPNLHEEWDRGAIVKLPRWLGRVLAFCSLPYLALIFIFWCVKNLGGRLEEVKNNPITQLSIGYLCLIAVGMVVVSYIGLRRWRKEDSVQLATQSSNQLTQPK